MKRKELRLGTVLFYAVMYSVTLADTNKSTFILALTYYHKQSIRHIDSVNECHILHKVHITPQGIYCA